jgi:hypothetical protein
VCEAFEDLQVECLRVDADYVPGAAGLDCLLAEHLAERGDVALDEIPRRLRWVLAPQAVDEPRGRHERVGLTEKQRKQRPLFRSSEAYRLAVDRDLERPEELVLDAHPATLLRLRARALPNRARSARVDACAAGRSSVPPSVSALARSHFSFPAKGKRRRHTRSRAPAQRGSSPPAMR